jgi:hypothetical protein
MSVSAGLASARQASKGETWGTLATEGIAISLLPRRSGRSRGIIGMAMMAKNRYGMSLRSKLGNTAGEWTLS